MQQDTQGRLLIGLTSNPTKGTLEGTVFEANNLTKQDVFGLAGKFHHLQAYAHIMKVYLRYSRRIPQAKAG